MAYKLAVYLKRAGARPDLIVAAYAAALDVRMRALGDVFHREMLHPARTVLILLEDTACRSETVLCAAALTESEFNELRIPDGAIRAGFGDAVADLVAAVPRPAGAGEDLLEQLLTCSDDVALIAVAERLDHARHLHFRDPSGWRAFFSQIEEVYLPFSARISERLASRLARWAGAFERRFLA